MRLRMGDTKSKRTSGQTAGWFDADTRVPGRARKGFLPVMVKPASGRNPTQSGFKHQEDLLTHETKTSQLRIPPGTAGLGVRGCPTTPLPSTSQVSSQSWLGFVLSPHEKAT